MRRSANWLRALTDTAAFTTGPRKSMALQSFKVREGETFASMRSRMASIVSAIATTEVRVGPGGKRMFATFSKPRELRERGDHSAWIRRTIRSLNADQESALEVDYNTGGAWLHGRKIASAVDAPGDQQGEDLYHNEDRTGRPWLDVKEIATALSLPAAKVRATLEEQKR